VSTLETLIARRSIMKIRDLLFIALPIVLLAAGCSTNTPVDNSAERTPIPVDTVGNWPPFNSKPFSVELPRDFYLATIAQKGNIVYFIGGIDSAGNGESHLRAFDLATGSWSEKAPMKIARYDAGAVVIGNSIYVIGGRNDGTPDAEEPKVERYDIATDSWTSLPDIPTGFRDPMRSYDGTYPNHFTACNGKIYALNSPMRIFGPDDTLLSLFESSDGEHWTEHRSQFRRWQEPTMVASDDRVYIFGSRGVDTTSYMYEFDPATGAFTEKQAPKYNTRGYASRGSIWVGGRIFKLNSYETSPKIMEVYSAASDSWSDLPVPFNVTNNAVFYPIVTDGAGSEIYFFSTPRIRNGFYLNTVTNALFTR
jgi:hypothetical protein